MGLVLPVVGYVSGKGVEAGDPSTPYNIQKKAFVATARRNLQEFYEHVEKTDRELEGPGYSVMRRRHSGPEIVFESDRDNRGELQALLGCCTLVATQPSDLCREGGESAEGERSVFRDLVNSSTPVFLVPGFRVHGYANGFYKRSPELYATGEILMERLSGRKYLKLKPEPLFDLVSSFMQYTLDIRWRDSESAKRRVEREP
jgi:hypothetical protein